MSQIRNQNKFTRYKGLMLKNLTTTTTLPTSQPYSISIKYGNQRRLYCIMTDLTIEALIVFLKKAFKIEDRFGIYLYSKVTKRLLNGIVKLSQLLCQSSLFTQIKKGVNDQKQGIWKEMLKSNQFRTSDIINCRTFIQLTMAVVEFAG